MSEVINTHVYRDVLAKLEVFLQGVATLRLCVMPNFLAQDQLAGGQEKYI